VCINGVLHHIVDLQRAIAELVRVTKHSVFVSEESHSPQTGLDQVLSYPGFGRKLLSALSLALWNGHDRLFRRGIQGARSTCTATSSVSQYERPLNAATVETHFHHVGFNTKHLHWWTNVMYPRNQFVKRLLTIALANESFGTYFDLWLTRENC
jgi:hypothetical protein